MTPEQSENVEMTPEYTQLEEEDEKMNIDSVQVKMGRQQTHRIQMFKRLDSKMCIVTVLGYFISWEQTEKFFRCLNKSGQAYFDFHKTQFRYFINDNLRSKLLHYEQLSRKPYKMLRICLSFFFSVMSYYVIHEN